MPSDYSALCAISPHSGHARYSLRDASVRWVPVQKSIISAHTGALGGLAGAGSAWQSVMPEQASANHRTT